jgi:hypothetical protein
MEVTNERLAQRQNYFREANERIEYAATMARHIGTRPFICECSLDGCVAHVEIEAAEYDEVRGHPARFVTLPGHEVVEIEVMITRNERYQIVEKVDRFAQIAVGGNPRR